MPTDIDTPSRPPRIEIIDALRGLAVILMVIHHALFDAWQFLGAPSWVFWNPVFEPLHNLFAGVFIALAGVSSRFSRSNWRRGGMCALAAMLVTFVTSFMGETVKFGILHLLASCMLVYALCEEVFKKILQRPKPNPRFGVAWVALIVGSAIFVARTYFNFPAAWLFGWYPENYHFTDDFPLLPWAFVYGFGTWLGRYIRERRFPARFYDARVPVLPAVGRRSMVIYLLHQPILFGIVQVILAVRG
ncbi:MAG: DUF1624 domain-containing protein [Oscillospiraceae bacterium]|nr:DUF1624 domain-containing protein [Oscillospiraceae bacterium]